MRLLDPVSLICLSMLVVTVTSDTVLRFRSQHDLVNDPVEEHSENSITVDRSYIPMQEYAVRNICPNGVTQCSATTTCCRLRNGQYGCCDGISAVCCVDGVHCCPEGFQCEMEKGQCSSSTLDLSIPWVDRKVVRARPLASPHASINLTCPDRKTLCEQNDTCCNATVGYGCCPMPHAECCSDKLHCCPNNTKCDLVHQRCYKPGDQSWTIPWFNRHPLDNPKADSRESSLKMPQISRSFAALKEIVQPVPGGVTCNDGNMCPDGDTCCLLTDGSYGCCPYTDAICCSDHVHCCPSNCVCDYAKQGCVGHWVIQRWRKIRRPKFQQVLSGNKGDKNPVNGIVCPDGKSQCPDGSTCCQLTEGTYGCCPKANATCCSDHVHCCASGCSCDVVTASCKCSAEDSSSIPWTDSKAADTGSDVPCPGGESECSDGQTCCQLKSGKWGCCPYPVAVCCEDHEHCCPQGFTCDVPHQKCVRGNLSISMTQKQPAKPMTPSNNICPDGSQCPGTQTCCIDPSKAYLCCPLPEATCCSDGEHCCPQGYTCNLPQETCDKGPVSLPLVTKTQSVARAKTVVCPDHKSECPDGSTCCDMGDHYGCCPIQNAVCCSDHLHCCPSGYTCDVAKGTCDKGVVSVPWDTKLPAIVRKEEDITCPDGSSCPDGQTCCLISRSDYGCCPQTDATCCSDYKHCCPNGFICDVSAGKCNKGSMSLPWSLKHPATPKPAGKVDTVICPDGSYCPGLQTCCQLPSGHYGCCPFPLGVCCSDHLHCCPNGFICSATGTCFSGSESLPGELKRPSIPAGKEEDITCPDGSSCPDGQTCCLISRSDYGCCPQTDATCCSDYKHCCPNGFICDVSAGKCNKGTMSLPWSLKHPATPKPAGKVDTVICPDGSYCPGLQTCCQLPSGHYGCCPFPLGVCCSDHLHCCPNGFICSATGTCFSGSESLPGELKRPSIPAGKVDRVVCPDSSSCPDQQTCCLLLSGDYGCCPKPQAVCCSDHLHCCPNGYTCNVAASTCVRGLESQPWESKRPSIPAGRVQDVNCDDGSSCPDGQTCCELESGEYGCCPYPQAECCSDHLHCCPNGYSCNVAAGSCDMGSESIAWKSKQPSIPAGKVQDIQCPDGSSCADDQTCCQLASGGYGCCPDPVAVCCSDLIHCCPNGYKCNLLRNTCDKGALSIPLKMKQPSSPARKEKTVTCPDQSSCDDGQTCCQVASKEYGCCPMPEAVCCSDFLHCCPNGYKCDITGGTCTKGTESLPWAVKKPSMRSLP